MCDWQKLIFDVNDYTNQHCHAPGVNYTQCVMGTNSAASLMDTDNCVNPFQAQCATFAKQHEYPQSFLHGCNGLINEYVTTGSFSPATQSCDQKKMLKVWGDWQYNTKCGTVPPNERGTCLYGAKAAVDMLAKSNCTTYGPQCQAGTNPDAFYGCNGVLNEYFYNLKPK